MKARELGRGSIVVGDRVSLIGDVSGGHGHAGPGGPGPAADLGAAPLGR